MAVLGLRFLDAAEEDLVHAKSVECLESIGVRVHSPSVLSLLGDAGAVVDPHTKVAKVPEALVKDALRTAPKSMVLGGRERGRDLRLPAKGYPYSATGGVTLSITDSETGEKRDATTKDLAELARLSDALDAIDAFWPLVTTSDV